MPSKPILLTGFEQPDRVVEIAGELQVLIVGRGDDVGEQCLALIERQRRQSVAV